MKKIAQIVFILIMLSHSSYSKSYMSPWKDLTISGDFEAGSFEMVMNKVILKLKEKHPLDHQNFTRNDFIYIGCDNIQLESQKFNTISLMAYFKIIMKSNKVTLRIEKNRIIFINANLGIDQFYDKNKLMSIIKNDLNASEVVGYFKDQSIPLKESDVRIPIRGPIIIRASSEKHIQIAKLLEIRK